MNHPFIWYAFIFLVSAMGVFFNYDPNAKSDPKYQNTGKGIQDAFVGFGLAALLMTIFGG